MKNAAIIIITIGFAFTIFSSSTYWVDETIDIGKLDAGRNKLRTAKLSPLIGIGIMGIGGILLWKAFEKKKNPSNEV